MALDGCEFVVCLGDPIFIDSYFYSNLTASECCFFRRFFKPFIITHNIKQCITLSKIVIFHSQLYSVGKMKTVGLRHKYFTKIIFIIIGYRLALGTNSQEPMITEARHRYGLVTTTIFLKIELKCIQHKQYWYKLKMLKGNHARSLKLIS